MATLTPPPARRRTPRLVWNFLALGAILRLVNLNAWSLWLDEGATWSWAVLPTWGGTFFAEPNHPPLWWLITRAWISIFGDSEVALRMPGAILGVVSVWLAWRLGLRLMDPAHAPRRGGFPKEADGGAGHRAAIWFTGLVATAAYLLEFSQEARMYPALLVETLGLCLLYLRWLDRGDRRSLFGYAVVAVLALHTHYFSIWPLVAHAAHALWLGWTTRRTVDAVRPWPFLAAIAVAGLLFIPWFTYFAANYHGIAKQPGDAFSKILYVIWRIGAGPGIGMLDASRRADEGIQTVIDEDGPAIAFTAALWFIPVLLGAIALRRRRGVRSFVVANFALPVVLLVAMHPWMPLIHERYVSHLAPWLFLLAAVAAASAYVWLRPLILTALAVLMATGVAAYHGADSRLNMEGRNFNVGTRPAPLAFRPDPDTPLYVLNHGHPYGREPWRDAYDFVHAYAQADDVVCLHPMYLELVWRYYDRDREEERLVLLPMEALDLDQTLHLLGKRLERCSRIFLVLCHEDTPDPDHYVTVLRGVCERQWSSFGMTKPILFDLSRGIRVVVFSTP